MARPRAIYVLDASVFVKWFVEEPDTPQALTLKTAYLEGSCDLTSQEDGLPVPAPHAHSEYRAVSVPA